MYPQHEAVSIVFRRVDQMMWCNVVLTNLSANRRRGRGHSHDCHPGVLLDNKHHESRPDPIKAEFVRNLNLKAQMFP